MMTHLEYLTALTDRLAALDGTSWGHNQNRKTYDGTELDPEFIDKVARGLGKKMRREGLL